MVNWDGLEAHRPALRRFLRGKCPTEADIDDCVQEALLRVAQVADLDMSRVGALLKTVAYNAAMDLHRDQRRRAAALTRLGVSYAEGPEGMVIQQQEARRLASHARALSLKERAALAGRAHGFAPHEVAAWLGTPPKSVHLALSRARTTLRRLGGGAIPAFAWLFRRASRRLKLASPALAAVALGLLFQSSLTVNPPGRAPLQVSSEGLRSNAPFAPLGRHRDSPLTSASGVSIHTPPSSARRTIAAVVVGSRNVVQAGASLTEVNPQQPLLVGVADCLRPGAISLDPHHAGCSG